jgi:hypothetical protein
MANRRITRIPAIASAVALMTISTVFFAGEKYVFTHKPHIEEYNTECVNCHNEEADPPVLLEDGCEQCHDEALDEPVLEVKAKRYEIIFSHELHNNVALCPECHEATAKDRQKKNEPMMTYARCYSCHEENAIHIAEFRCEVCHRTTNRQTRPDTHKKTWMRSHGKAAEWNMDMGHGNDCTMCHAKQECNTCHRTMKPRDHTGLWRLRTHGFQAEMNRERCKTCHETGVCINCHRNTAPQNHRGAWRKLHGAAANAAPERCRVCHNPAYGSSVNCIECHGGAR